MAPCALCRLVAPPVLARPGHVIITKDVARREVVNGGLLKAKNRPGVDTRRRIGGADLDTKWRNTGGVLVVSFCCGCFLSITSLLRVFHSSILRPLLCPLHFLPWNGDVYMTLNFGDVSCFGADILARKKKDGRVDATAEEEGRS